MTTNKRMLFERCTNVDYLKKKIIPLTKKVCDKTTLKHKKNKKGFVFPYKYYLDLLYICKLYGVEKLSFIPYCFGEGAGGYNKQNKEIYLMSDHNNFISMYNICTIFTHELAHRIQHREWENNKDFTINRFKKALLYERTAERLAYFINKEYFKHLSVIHHKSYTSYTSKQDIDFLKKHYDGNLIKNRWKE